jgi:hypothetical protein
VVDFLLEIVSSVPKFVLLESTFLDAAEILQESAFPAPNHVQLAITEMVALDCWMAVVHCALRVISMPIFPKNVRWDLCRTILFVPVIMDILGTGFRANHALSDIVAGAFSALSVRPWLQSL